jgi:hypothetical protein
MLALPEPDFSCGDYSSGESAYTADQMLSYGESCAKAEREACADMLSINRNEAQLMAGEMTSGEWRTLAAVLKGLQSLTRSNVRLVMKANNKE